MSEIRDQLQRCEEAVRAGRIPVAAAILSALSAKDIPRPLLAQAANLCRRTGKIALGLRWLAPVVRPKTPAAPARDAEIAEYAVLLQRTGGVGEALRLLESLGDRGPAETRLYRAFCHFARWDYARAVPELEAYLAGELAPYARVVGEVNLASALIGANADERALALLRTLLARPETAPRLRGNCLEMKAQLEMRAGRPKQARRDAEAALALLTGGWDRLFVDKWRSFIEASRTGDPAPLLETQRRAADLRHHETVRDLDHLILRVRFDEERFHRLYFGTPSAVYRAKIVESLGRPPACAEYVCGAPGAAPLEFDGTDKLSRLLRFLARDLYRPVKTGALFAELFPEEHFDIFHSPNRVHQLLRRARARLEETGADVRIHGERGDFRLELGPSAALRLRLDELPAEPHEIWWGRLRATFGPGAGFTAREARARLGLSAGQFRRFAAWAQERRRLQVYGAGPATVYEIDAGALRPDARSA